MTFIHPAEQGDNLESLSSQTDQTILKERIKILTEKIDSALDYLKTKNKDEELECRIFGKDGKMYVEDCKYTLELWKKRLSETKDPQDKALGYAEEFFIYSHGRSTE